MKLARIMKEFAVTKDLLLKQYIEHEKQRELIERLRGLNANLSKEVKILKNENMELLDETKKLREIVQRKSKN